MGVEFANGQGSTALAPFPAALNPSQTIMHYKGITSTFSSAEKWSAFIGGIFSALEARYSAEEVQRWRVEVWNEPQGCGFFWCVTPPNPARP